MKLGRLIYCTVLNSLLGFVPLFVAVLLGGEKR